MSYTVRSLQSIGYATIRVSKLLALSEVIRPEGTSTRGWLSFHSSRLSEFGIHAFFRGILNGKRVQANLGAKNHAVIMSDGIAHVDYR